MLFSSVYKSSSYFKQHISLPHWPLNFGMLIESIWFFALFKLTPSNWCKKVVQQSCKPQTPIPPMSWALSLEEICLSSILQWRAAANFFSNSLKSTRSSAAYVNKIFVRSSVYWEPNNSMSKFNSFVYCSNKLLASSERFLFILNLMMSSSVAILVIGLISLSNFNVDSSLGKVVTSPISVPTIVSKTTKSPILIDASSVPK